MTLAEKGLRFGNERLASVTYTLKQLENNTAQVTMSGTHETHSYHIAFELIPNPSHAWKITDIDVSGALLSRNYRSVFNRIFREEGISGLMSRMQAKQTELVAKR